MAQLATQAPPSAVTTPPTTLPDLDKVAALVTGARDRLLDHPGVPSEAEAAAALRVCAEAAELLTDAAVQPRLSSEEHRAGTAASSLLGLDEGAAGGAAGAKSTSKSASTVSTASTAASTAATVAASTTAAASAASASAAAASGRRLRHVVNQISDAAYAVVVAPRVFLTPELLAQYVHIQATLGRPESLPHVLELYATKPAPVADSDGRVTFRAAHPGRPSSAVDPDVAAAALDAALAARSLDAAVGVVEHTYAAPAFVRAKLLRRGLLPGFVVVGVPPAVWILASQLADAAPHALDPRAATGLVFAGLLAYIAFTGTIGVVASATANDQMRRVTWAPGTPLRQRWLREDERAALDAVACAFGFREAHRYGEEEGAEFQALREYILRKGMLIDQVDLMEGMGS